MPPSGRIIDKCLTGLGNQKANRIEPRFDETKLGPAFPRQAGSRRKPLQSRPRRAGKRSELLPESVPAATNSLSGRQSAIPDCQPRSVGRNWPVAKSFANLLERELAELRSISRHMNHRHGSFYEAQRAKSICRSSSLAAGVWAAVERPR